jgi:transposase-like protein
MLTVECPRCLHDGVVVGHIRDAPHAHWQEIYMHCSLCRYDRVLEHTTPMIEQARKRALKASERVSFESRQHGAASVSALKLAAKAHSQLAQLKHQLREVIENANRTDNSSA